MSAMEYSLATRLAIGKTLVEYAIQAVCLVHVSVDRVSDLCWRVVTEVMVLTSHRTEAAHLPEQPLDHLGLAAKVGTHELSSLLSQIKKDRSRFKYPLIGLPSSFGS